MSLIDELKRRNVFKVSAAYLALGWVVTQITATVAPVLHLPEWVAPVVVWIGLIGFPFVVVFSWAYELTPEGLKRESEVDRSASITHVTSKRLDYIIIGLLVLAIGLFAFDRFSPRGEAPAKTATPATAAPTAAKAPPVDAKSIAVLPFINVSSDKEQEYFSDGLSEELLNLLAKIPELRVTSRSSAFTFKGKDLEIPEIAKRLNVAHILEGSVRKSGSQIRITAQLVDARTDTHLWSETYDRAPDDVFTVQDEIAGAVVAQLKIKLLGVAPKSKAVNPEAYALFLQGRQLYRQSTPESLEHAIALYQQALALDPGYAAAWHELARPYVQQAGFGLRPIDEAYALAREAVTKALALDPDNARAHDALGWIAKSYDGDLTAAAQHYQHALALEPGNLEIIGNAATLASNLGRLDTAIALNLYTISRDPVDALGQGNLGGVYMNAGRLDDAIAHFRTALNLAPGSLGQHFNVGLALLLKDQPEAALAELQNEPDAISRLIGLALINHRLGRNSESDTALDALIQKYAAQASYSIASVLAYRAEADRAFEWLDKAKRLHDAGLSSIVVDPLFANIKTDPRWLPFLQKLGMAPEQLAAIKFEVKLPR